MSEKLGLNNNKVYKLVLTGGPCGGKTTGQARLCTFFENLGWKVYRVPECATLLQGGGVKFSSLTKEQAYRFQSNLLRSMIQIEETFFDLASGCRTNCLVICDRGTMDASAYLKPDEWVRMKEEYGYNEVDLRDSRYNQVVHLISAAQGAEDFYHLENNETRTEGVEVARHLDRLTSQAWVGHPYFELIDNSTDFERKIVRVIAAVCNRLGIEAGDRLSMDTRKRKFLVRSLPEDLDSNKGQVAAGSGKDVPGVAATANVYPQFQDFIVVHDYLVTPHQRSQARIRRRGQKGHWTYQHTVRSPRINNESPEKKMQISSKEYKLLLAQRDNKRYTIYKKRRCFLWNNTYFQMDIYQEPCHQRCKGLILLETYTSKGDDLQLPDFLHIEREVTKESYYSMYNLSRRDSSVEEMKKTNSDNTAKLDVHHNTEYMVNGGGPTENGKELSNGTNGVTVMNGHGV